MNSHAVAEVAECLPLIVPADPHFVTVDELMDRCDGFLLTGGRPNVHPSEYGEEETEAHGTFDRCRDAITLPLILVGLGWAWIDGDPLMERYIGAAAGFIAFAAIIPESIAL